MGARFLTDDELIELTGYKLAAKQAESLDKNKVRYFRRADGKVRVTWEQVNNLANNAANDNDGFNPDFM